MLVEAVDDSAAALSSDATCDGSKVARGTLMAPGRCSCWKVVAGSTSTTVMPSAMSRSASRASTRTVTLPAGMW